MDTNGGFRFLLEFESRTVAFSSGNKLKILKLSLQLDLLMKTSVVGGRVDKKQKIIFT